jgi:lysophospholipase L1-like esterase
MTKAGARCEAHVYAGQPHGFFNKEPYKTATLIEADKFLGALGWLKGEPTLTQPAIDPAAVAPMKQKPAENKPNIIFILADDLALPASPTNYLAPVVSKLEEVWPKNHLVNIVFHGHSVPSGYFKTPAVDSLHAYPNLLRVALAEKYSHAVINVIVTAIGGEASDTGAARFDADVLTHKPDVLFIDYALNDRRIGLEKAKAAWTEMIQKALAADVKVILLKPTPDQSSQLDDPADPLNQHAEQIRRLAAEYHVGLVDSLAKFKAALVAGTPLTNLMAQVNHPNAAGHQLVAEELVKWFPSKG